MKEFFSNIWGAFESTNIPEQVKDVDFAGLFTNPWFMVPFVIFVGYLVYKLKWRDLVFVAIFIFVWWLSGTNYMQTLVVGEELQVNKVLPVLFGGAVLLGIVIYLLFGRSD